MIINIGGQKPRNYSLDELVNDVINAVPLEDWIKEAYGPVYAYVPLNSDINASMAELLASRIIRRCHFTPNETFLGVLSRHLTDSFTSVEIIDALPEALAEMESLLASRLSQRELQAYL